MQDGVLLRSHIIVFILLFFELITECCKSWSGQIHTTCPYDCSAGCARLILHSRL